MQPGRPEPEEEHENGELRSQNLADDGRPKSTDSWLRASIRIMTAVLGSGGLSMVWAIAQLGWVIGICTILAFAALSLSSSTLLADFYKSPDAVTGNRNYTYIGAVREYLGGWRVTFYRVAVYVNLVGTTILHAITASESMEAMKKSHCIHKGLGAECYTSYSPNIMIFASIQLILSQIPEAHKLAGVLAAVMSFSYSCIGLGLSIDKLAGGRHGRTSLTGTTIGVDVTAAQKIWRAFESVGEIAFANAYFTGLFEIQDKIKSGHPENKDMKRAIFVGILTTTIFHLLCGCLGYAAFGNDAPPNFLADLAVHESFWLIYGANVCVAVHFIFAYQVVTEPIFSSVENNFRQRWAGIKFITSEYKVNIPLYGVYSFNAFRLLGRTLYVIVTAIVAMILPFFNDFMGLIGAAAFWPSVYFPTEMYIQRTRMPKFSLRWTSLKILSFACLVVSLVGTAGSIEGLINSFKTHKPF